MFRFISHFIGLDIGDVHTATYHLHANAEQSEFRLPENAYMNQPLISIARTNLTLSLSLFLPFGWVYSFVWWWASILEPQPHNDSISIISIRISFQLILIVFTVDLRATNKCYSATHHNCKTKSQQQNIKTSEMHKIESHSHTHTSMHTMKVHRMYPKRILICSLNMPQTNDCTLTTETIENWALKYVEIVLNISTNEKKTDMANTHWEKQQWKLAIGAYVNDLLSALIGCPKEQIKIYKL